MKNRQTFKLSVLTVSLLSATTALAATDSPFSIPLHLSGNVTNGVRQTIVNEKTQEFFQDTATEVSVSYSGGMKPNIMLYIDDSNSMNSPVSFSDPRIDHFNSGWYHLKRGGCLLFDSPGSSSGGYYCAPTTRWTMLRRSIYEMLDENYTDKSGNTATYGSRANWGILYMNTYGGVNGTSHNSNFQPNRGSVDALKQSLSGAKTANTTPFGGGLGHAVNQLYNSIEYRCQKNYVIAFSDGDANVNATGGPLKQSPWNDVVTPKYCGYPANAFNTASLVDPMNYSGLGCINGQDLKKSGNDKAGKSWNDPEFPNQTIEIFSIGYGVSNKTRSVMTDLASKNIYDSDGTQVQTAYFPNTGDGMREAFRNIFAAIAGQNTSSTVPTVTVTSGSPVSNPVIQSGSASDDTFISEESYSIAAPGMISTDSTDEEMITEAATILVDKNMRSAQIFFDKRNDDGSINTTGTRPTAQFGSGLFFVRDGDNVVRRLNYSRSDGNSFFDIQDPVDNVEYKDGLLTWLSRGSVNKSRYKAEKYRNDRGQMGDVIESDILALGKRINGKKELVVTAANDGLVYVFKRGLGNDDIHPYNFAYNYMPASMVRSGGDDTLSKHYHKIAKEDYAENVSINPHIFMLSGGIIAQQFEKHDADGNPYLSTAFMIGNAGRGARGTYGLKLADENGNGLSEATPLFKEVDAGTTGFSGLGYTVGYPITGYVGINVSKNRKNGTIGACTPGDWKTCDVGSTPVMATLLGSGIASAGKENLKAQETYLYLFKPLENGQQIASVQVSEGEGGLMTPTMLDIDFDGVYDYAFAGDYGGNVYRFDIRNYNNITYKKIFNGNGWSGSYPKRPISAAPTISRQEGNKYVVIFGTGSDVFDDDLTSDKTQALYGIYQEFDDNLDIKTEFNSTLSDGDLLQQEFSGVTVSADPDNIYRVASDHSIKDSTGALTHKGWKIELTGAGKGERIVVKPQVIQKTVYAVTRIYSQTDSDTGSISGTPISGTSTSIPDDIKNDVDALNAWFSSQPGWKKVKSPSATHPDATSCDWDNIPEQLISDDTVSSGSGGSSSGDPCASDSSSTRTMKKQKKCQVSWIEETVWEKADTSSKNFSTSSSVIQLKTDNGGAIPIPPGKGYSFITWNYDSGSAYYASSQTTRGIQSLSYHGAHETGKVLNHMGENNGSGTIGEFGEVPKVDPDKLPNATKLCIGGARAYNAWADRTNSDINGNSESLKININMQGVICYRRISWREVF